MQYLYLNKDFDDLDDYYEVEKIITRRFNGKNKLYLIKWLGYPITDCTWEPISHLGNINTLVEKFDEDFPNSIDKRRLRKYLHSINKRKNKRIFRNKNKIKQKSFLLNKNNRNNHIIINLEDSTILDEKIHEEANTIDDSIVENIEISEEKNKDNNTEEGNLFELIDDNSKPKLIKPIIIW